MKETGPRSQNWWLSEEQNPGSCSHNGRSWHADVRGNSEKKLVSLEEGVADLKVRRKNRISFVGDFRFTLPTERKRWMKKREKANGICGCFTRMGTLSVSFTTGLRRGLGTQKIFNKKWLNEH